MTPHDSGAQLLSRHFFRRFFDNDLVSPGGDAHENVAVVLAFLATPGLVMTVPLMFRYLHPLISPARRMILALDDKFLCLACSMVVMALVTVVEWDALSLDERDLAILGPLPLKRRTLVGAKVRALALFAGIFAVAINAIPSLIYPLLFVGSLPISLARGVWLMAVHAAISLAAAAFGFLAFLALRETLGALLGPRLFRSASVAVQAACAVALVTTLLLLPGLSSNLSASALSRPGWRVYGSPPMWFLGLYETLTSAGTVLGPAAAQVPGRRPVWTLEMERQARAAYVAHEPIFHELAGIALVAFAAVGLVAVCGYALKTRQLQRPPPAPAGVPRWLRAAASSVAGRLIVRHPVAQAGFFFTLQTVARSGSQRLYMAGFIAVALAAGTVMLAPVDVRQALGASTEPPLEVLALQLVLSFFLVAGLRVVFAIPAELKANWMFQVSWTGDQRRYLAGVRRAVRLVVVLALCGMLVPVQVLWPRALGLVAGHLAWGILASLVLIEISLLGLRKLPFTCSYVPGSAGLKFWWPLYFGAFLAYVYGLSWVERYSLRTDSFSWALLGLLTVFLSAVACRRWLLRRPAEIVFDEPPDQAVQTLGVGM